MFKGGDVVGKLTILKRIGEDNFLCKCECGNNIIRSRDTLRNGAGRGCGCYFHILKYDIYIKQEQRYIYTSYIGMRYRCYKKTDISYPNYGGRGIKICDEWLNDFVAFYQWAIKNGAKPGLSIDRIDVNGNYEPSNCRWANPKEQGRNKRTNRRITVNGITRCLSEWAELLCISDTSLSRGLEKDSNYIQKRLNNTLPKRINHFRNVFQYDLNGNLIKKHKSIKAAAEFIGSKYDAINSACRRNTHRHKGCLWYFGELKWIEMD